MKPYILGILLVISGISSFAQSMLGIYAGIGSTSFKKFPPQTNAYPTTGASSHIRSRIGISYFKRDSLHRHRYFGAKLFVEEYSFLYELRTGGHGGNTYIDHNSMFLFLAPAFGLGLGRKQVLHFNVILAGGVKLHANQMTHSNYLYTPYGSSSQWLYKTESSVADVETFIFRPGISFSQHIKIHRNWDIVITEGGSVMIGNLTKYKNDGVHPGSLYIAAGITRIFKRLPIPPKTDRKPFKSRL